MEYPFVILFFRVHQTHYEQHGQINGKVIIDGDEHNLSVECVRDHTFGKLYNCKYSKKFCILEYNFFFR